MSLKDVLQKLRVVDLQNEIRKVLADFKGFKNMTKSQLIEVMLENESLFKHLEKLDTTKFKKENVPKPKGKIQKQRAEDKPVKEKLKKEPNDYVKFVKQYRMENNLSLKDAMKEIKEKGLFKAKTPAKPKKKLTKEEEEVRKQNKIIRDIRKKFLEYEKTVTDDPARRDKGKFLQLKKIIGKNTPVQKKRRKLLREKTPKLYQRLKELNFFEDINIEKEEPKKEEPKKEEPKKEEPDVKPNEKVEATKKPKKEKKKKPKKKPKKELTLDEMKERIKKLKNENESIDERIDELDRFQDKSNAEKKELQELRDRRDENKKEIRDLDDKIFVLEEKQKEEEEEEKKLLQFKINVEKFIKKPTQALNDEIIEFLDLVDELSEKDQDRLNKALDKFEAGEEEEEPKKEEPKKKERKKIKLVTFQEPKKKKSKNVEDKIKKKQDEIKKLEKKRKDNYEKTAMGVKPIDKNLETDLLIKISDLKDEIKKLKKKSKK